MRMHHATAPSARRSAHPLECERTVSHSCQRPNPACTRPAACDLDDIMHAALHKPTPRNRFRSCAPGSRVKILKNFLAINIVKSTTYHHTDSVHTAFAPKYP